MALLTFQRRKGGIFWSSFLWVLVGNEPHLTYFPILSHDKGIERRREKREEGLTLRFYSVATIAQGTFPKGRRRPTPFPFLLWDPKAGCQSSLRNFPRRRPCFLRVFCASHRRAFCRSGRPPREAQPEEGNGDCSTGGIMGRTDGERRRQTFPRPRTRKHNGEGGEKAGS